MLNPERVSDVLAPDVESMPIAHNALHREAPRSTWGDILPHPSSSHLSGQRELVEREGDRGKAGMLTEKQTRKMSPREHHSPAPRMV